MSAEPVAVAAPNPWMHAVSAAVRRKLKQPKAFVCFFFKSLEDGKLLTKGGVPLLKFIRGPRKGNWDFTGCKVLQCTLSKSELEIIDRKLMRRRRLAA